MRNCCGRLILGHSRDAQRGSALLFTLLAAMVLLILGEAYLSVVERDNRFAAHQERSERAWHLAMSGLEYYRLYGCNGQSISLSAPVREHPRVLLRVSVPEGSPSQYFELADMGGGVLLSRGVVAGTISSSGNSSVIISRCAAVPSLKLEDAYELSTVLENI